MKDGIHPAYHQVTVSCACGNSFVAGSTQDQNIRVEICANCHPLYTGKSKLIDTTGRVDRFQARQQKAAEAKAQASARLANRSEKEADLQAAEEAKTAKVT